MSCDILFWAVDQAWTDDLFLTKEVLYHWATTAINKPYSFYERTKVHKIFESANFLQEKMMFSYKKSAN